MSYEKTSQESNQGAVFSDRENKLVRSFLQPHFIFNTLTTIAYYCGKDPEKAEDLTLRFSDYLQGKLSSMSDMKEIRFSEELEAIRNYLEIEKCRFRDRIRVEYDIRCDNFGVPVLSIQPIVENAVKHGVFKKKGGGTILISTAEEESSYTVTVKDDGAGFDMSKVESDGKEHFGIQNVKARIRSAGGEIMIDSCVNVGTTVVIRFPKENTPC